MFDEELRPYILEINLGPNMWAGGASKETQISVKQPLMQQIGAWAAAHIGRSRVGVPATIEEREAIEANALRDFDRVL